MVVALPGVPRGVSEGSKKQHMHVWHRKDIERDAWNLVEIRTIPTRCKHQNDCHYFLHPVTLLFWFSSGLHVNFVFQNRWPPLFSKVEHLAAKALNVFLQISKPKMSKVRWETLDWNSLDGLMHISKRCSVFAECLKRHLFAKTLLNILKWLIFDFFSVHISLHWNQIVIG